VRGVLGVSGVSLAAQQSLDGHPRHAQHGLRLLFDQGLERDTIQPQQFGIAQRAYLDVVRLAAEQAHLAHTLTGGDQVGQCGRPVKYAKAAAAQHIQGVGRLACLEKRPPSRQAQPAQLLSQRRPSRIIEMREHGSASDHIG